MAPVTSVESVLAAQQGIAQPKTPANPLDQLGRDASKAVAYLEKVVAQLGGCEALRMEAMAAMASAMRVNNVVTAARKGANGPKS